MNRPSPDLNTLVRTCVTHVANLLFPPSCVACDAIGQPLCDRCAQRFLPPPVEQCATCGRLQVAAVARCSQCLRPDHFAFDFARAAVLHQPPATEAVYALKYRNRPELAPSLARYLTAAFWQADWAPYSADIDLVIPVPMHAERRHTRGYNQAELLAEAFCRQTGKQHAPAALSRIEATRSQVGLSADQRRSNVQHAFRATADVQGRTILLIDDVYTTGATLDGCARALKKCGAHQVLALTLALPQLHLGPIDKQGHPH